jgi:hypothetical protein
MKRNVITVAVLMVMYGSAAGQTRAFDYETKEIKTVLTAGGVTGAWSRGITGSGVTIAIVDQGFDLTQKDFVFADGTSKIAGFKNFYPSQSKDWGYHGTMMAGIAAGSRNSSGTVGVAPDAMLLLAQVSEGGLAGTINRNALAQAIDWASAAGATVINLSLGSTYDTNFQKTLTRNSDGTWKAPANYGSMYGQTSLNSYKVGTDRGSIIVAAAGNQGLAYAQFPGAFATQIDSTGKLVLGGRMLMVGATDPTGRVIAPFSNRAGHICTNYAGAVCADPYQVKDFFVVAPGMAVYGSVANQQGFKDAAGNTNTSGSIGITGTSPAAAYVSGGIALMKQAWPQLRPEQLVALVLNTAKDLGAKGVDEVYGHGLVDFDAATRPMGALVLANNTRLSGSGPEGKTLQLQGTGVVTAGAVNLSTSSVLQNAQAVDDIGRNYSVDLTRTVSHSNALSYQYGTPWMAMAGANYKQVAATVGKDAVLTIMSSDGGAASQYEWQHRSGTRLKFETGVLQEKSGFLGTQGSGALAFGGSNTVWTGMAFDQQISGNTALIGNYSVGVTRTSNVADSMVQLSSSVVADSWKLGVAHSNILFEGRTHDTLSFAVSSPVAVRKGSATVTGVTGYSYTDNSDGTTDANPVTQSERVSLSPQARAMDLVLGYTVAVQNTTSLGVNFVRQFNAGGSAGALGYGVSFMARSVF